MGIYPYGSAVWIRPLFSLLGIGGALMLLAGIRGWGGVLAIWCLLQCWVVARDVSGMWFDQGLFAGAYDSSYTKNNEVMTAYRADGFNWAGLILLVMLVIVACFRLYPSLRRAAVKRWRRMLAVPLLAVIVMSSGWMVMGAVERSRAKFVVDFDLPAVPIYYKGQLLGRTPLAITPEKIRDWNLPLTQLQNLKMYSWGWGDSVMLSDGIHDLPLYAGPRWPFNQLLDTFDTPWGLRCRAAISAGEETGRLTGYVFRKAELRDEPILKIAFVGNGAVRVGGSIDLNCALNNPTARTYTGRLTRIERKAFSYVDRIAPPTTFPAGFCRQVDLPDDWNALPPGARKSSAVSFSAPLTPGEYEFFCTWELFKSGTNDGYLAASSYSNMLSLSVLPKPTVADVKIDQSATVRQTAAH